MVVEKRDMLGLQKKSRVIEQGIIKDRKCGDNKKQIELDRWDKRLEKLRSTFDKKKNAIFNRLQEIEEDSLKSTAQKKADTDKLKKKFAAEFIKQRIVERQAKEKRQQAEETVRIKNSAWLQKQKSERDKQSKIFNVSCIYAYHSIIFLICTPTCAMFFIARESVSRVSLYHARL